jgi:hypothetical protein
MRFIEKKMPEYPGYRITNTGRVISYKTGERVDKKYHLDKDGYCVVSLKCNGKSIKRRVHRLVAEAFIPNPNNLPTVNHMNEDKTNNRVDNLEWMSIQENCEYSQSKKYRLLHIASGEITIVHNLRKTCRELGLQPGPLSITNPSSKCNRTANSHKGYRILGYVD